MELKLLKYFESIMETEVAKNILDSNGIKSMLEKSGIHFPGDGGDSMGAGLYVSEENLNKAKELLNL
ncbi:MAG: hypothetical protein WCV92_02035 [Candidatus Buchananbacteria bacterium]